MTITADLQSHTSSPSLWSRLSYDSRLRGYLLVLPTLLFVGLSLLYPLGLLFFNSFWRQEGMDVVRDFTFDNYLTLLGSANQLLILGKSLLISLAATVLVVVFSYPIAAYIAFGVQRHKTLWLLAVTIPFWTSYLLRVFAWKIILGYNGVINSSLISIGIIDKPLEILLYNPFAVVLTLAHAWAPFALLPIYISLSRIDRSLIEAARDLGESMFHVFRRVILPLSLPGVVAASLLIFIPTVGDYVTPQLVGGTSGLMVGNVVQSMFGRANNWPLGAAISVTAMIVVTAAACVFLKLTSRYGNIKGGKA
ncbi:ABC transporter permease [Sinorhizobium sp. BG8]|uniref:ABC transporter permease n=1 Tax=Sinorhizobium sp. BG8 TaxID=2613773 RepID=UPI00193DD350|nr:ABC transporter permease [Sinorhizobium sp. BG8]QRM55473.1 ABC transporter permease [Sinorhizobium sp. BG8]